jgi:hypothetical protein
MARNIAAVAVVAALLAAATAGAQSLIDGGDVRNNSLTGKDVKNKSLTKKDFRGSVRGPRGARGPAGAVGPQGPQGAQGPPGPANLSGLQTVPGPRRDSPPQRFRELNRILPGRSACGVRRGLHEQRRIRRLAGERAEQRTYIVVRDQRRQHRGWGHHPGGCALRRSRLCRSGEGRLAHPSEDQAGGCPSRYQARGAACGREALQLRLHTRRHAGRRAQVPARRPVL